MCKIGFSLQSDYAAPVTDVVQFLHAAGFCALSPTWQRDGELGQIVRAADRCGMTVQSLHGPFRGLPGMWNRDERQWSPLLQELLQAADDCAAYGIPVMVVHSWGGIHYSFQESELCFDSFDRLIDRAQRNGIQIAFENLEGPEYLDALLARYRDDSIGLCWDSGHELCYTPSRDFLKDYGDRLLMTHLNDNLGITSLDGQLLGTDDLHLLPGDGNTDWQQAVHKLKAAKGQEILNFELKIRPKGDRCTKDLYSQLPLEQYLRQAYVQSCRAVKTYFE